MIKSFDQAAIETPVPKSTECSLLRWALFFPPPSHSKSEDQDVEEQERVRALRFIVQDMTHWKSQVAPALLHHPRDKPLPASPASSLTQSTSSRAIHSCSSSTRIFHADFQHDLVLRHERPLVDGYLHKHVDSFPYPLLHPQEQEGQILCPIPDDNDSVQPSPTLSNFPCVYSRKTLLTTPYARSPASPTSVFFSLSPCSPENIAIPASPVDDQACSRESITGPAPERTPSSFQTSPVSKMPFPLSPSLGSLTVSPPKTDMCSASPSPYSFPVADPAAVDAPPQCLYALKLAEHSQSRWSVTTTACLTPSNAAPWPNALLNPRTPPKEKKNRGLTTPKKHARFINLISRLSPGRIDTSSTIPTSQTGDDIEYDPADNNTENKEKNKQRKSSSKKSSLASLRASFSLSRASFSSQRPSISSPTEEVPPLPTSPTSTSPLADFTVLPLPKASLSKTPRRANLVNTPLSPASAITTLQSPSQLSISDAAAASAFESRVSLVCLNPTPNPSRISLLPARSKWISLLSAAGIEPVVSTNPMPASQETTQSKSIFQLTEKPQSLETPMAPGTTGTAMPSRFPITGNTSLPSLTTTHSRIPQAPTKFTSPAKLATVIATQSRRAPALASPGPTSPTSELSMPPSRTPPTVPRSITTTDGESSFSSTVIQATDASIGQGCTCWNCQRLLEKTVILQ